MEKLLNIETPDKFKIYGVFHGATNTSADSGSTGKKLIIFIHGYTGNFNEHFLFNASPFFNAEGFDTYRFNSYWFESDARHLSTITFEEHCADLETLIKYFSDSYESIYLAGHSLASQIIPRTNLTTDKIKGIALWDPCREPVEICNDLTYDAGLGAYIDQSNVEIVVGKNFVESCKQLKQKAQEILPSIKIPIKVIGAENAGGKIATNVFFPAIQSDKELFIIQGSNHTFDESGAEKTLFEETLKWFMKHR